MKEDYSCNVCGGSHYVGGSTCTSLSRSYTKQLYPHTEDKIYPCQNCGYGNKFIAYRIEPVPQEIIKACYDYAEIAKKTLSGDSARIDAQYVLTGLLERWSK